MDLLVIKCPKKDCSIVNGLKDKFFRRFIDNCYPIKLLSNGETCDRGWLVYQTVTKMIIF
jgi:hypothetical protein